MLGLSHRRLLRSNARGRESDSSPDVRLHSNVGTRAPVRGRVRVRVHENGPEPTPENTRMAVRTWQCRDEL